MNIPDLMRRAAGVVLAPESYYDQKLKIEAELRAAAAEMEQAEPVAWYRVEEGVRIYYEAECWPDLIPLYPAPVAPAVPERIEVDECEDYMTGWNACREAMLEASPGPVVPEGWRVEPITAEGRRGFIIGTPRTDGIRANTAVFEDDENPAELMLFLMLSASPEPATRQEALDELTRLGQEMGDYDADGGEMRLTVSYLSSFLNEINKSEGGDRDELLEYHLERALQWLDAAMKEEQWKSAE